MTDTYQIAQIAAGAAAGLIAIAVFAQKFLNTWQSTKAESSVITIMHTELERMAEQNTKLSVELGKLQKEVIELNQALRNLTQENQRLQTEVTVLTTELTRLQSMLKQGAHNGLTG
jgi:chromosome segregation ATPase